MSLFKDKIVIHTDGACSGNPGPGGWGAIIAYPEGIVHELGDGARPTTNNKMELTAAISALYFVRTRTEEVYLCTDSTYVIRGITQWIWGWLKRGWKNAEGDPVANSDEWKELFRLVQDRGAKNISWNYVRGHTGNPGNERCDEIAVSFSKNQYCSLYKGPLLKYEHNPYDIPEDTSLPPMKPKQEKAAAYSYISVVNGQVARHATWPECERRVKGVSGAKFKKTLSEENEVEILNSWGYSSEDLN
ncbi:MAG: ribonuclease HI [Bdellovibrionaceae bacterium]|nr:ribonuclease HI [Pseudobdellovibrionaceae bacterium]